jgi:hypothetical protein
MAQPGRRRRWLLLTVLLLLVLIPGGLLAIAGALTYRPSWYQPRSIDYARLEDDKRVQLRLENQISAALNRNESVTIEVDQDQANRWIVARDELWPGEVPSLGPLREPQLEFLGENRLRVGALVEQAGVEVVISGTFHFDLQPDTITVTWDHINTGALRSPRRLMAKAARRAARKLGGRLSAAEIEQAIVDGKVTMPNDFVWPNGKRRVRIAELTIKNGKLLVKLEPL